MNVPDWLQALLPGETAVAWEQIAPVVPAEVYLAGGTAIAVHLRHRESRDLDFFFHEDVVDLDELAELLSVRGPFAITQRAPGTLNGLFGDTRLQFLQAGATERRLEPTIVVGGLHVAGLGDLLAMKLNAIVGRAQLRDYFDLMTIDQRGDRTVEEGLSLFLARYQPLHADSAITPIVLALGHLDDVGDDPFLPVERDTIVRYWQQRQPEILCSVERFGLSPSSSPDPRSIGDESRRPKLGPELDL